jgi:hypothetical protein
MPAQWHISPVVSLEPFLPLKGNFWKTGHIYTLDHLEGRRGRVLDRPLVPQHGRKAVATRPTTRVESDRDGRRQIASEAAEGKGHLASRLSGCKARVRAAWAMGSVLCRLIQHGEREPWRGRAAVLEAAWPATTRTAAASRPPQATASESFYQAEPPAYPH